MRAGRRAQRARRARAREAGSKGTCTQAASSEGLRGGVRAGRGPQRARARRRRAQRASEGTCAHEAGSEGTCAGCDPCRVCKVFRTETPGGATRFFYFFSRKEIFFFFLEPGGLSKMPANPANPARVFIIVEREGGAARAPIVLTHTRHSPPVRPRRTQGLKPSSAPCWRVECTSYVPRHCAPARPSKGRGCAVYWRKKGFLSLPGSIEPVNLSTCKLYRPRGCSVSSSALCRRV